MPMTDPVATAYAERLRAERAEASLAGAEEKLSRLLAMADAWDKTWGDSGIKASVAAEAVRREVMS